MTDVFLTDGDDFYLIDNYDPNGPLFHVLTRSGNDIVVGSSYRDTIEGQDGDDYLAGGGAADALYGDAGNDVLDGGEAADYIQGGSGNDIIDGGIGADQMWGGIGNDVFYVDDIFDKVFEDWGQGTDTVYASVTYVLPAGVEILIATGAGRLTLVGNDLHNTIIGNDAPNVLSGGLGNDRMEGKRGNDTYRVQSTGDQVVELPGEGFDLVELWVRMNYVLPVNIEDATALLGGNLTGNAAANSITVSADDLGGYRQYTDDILDGREGADRMAGGFGNDTYFVDNVLDRVFEGEVAGIDTVRSVVSFTLGDNVENLILTGVAGIGGTGNALANTMTGNAAGNALDGGMGVDRLVGGLGADTYFVDQLSDVVVETGTDIDTVFASSSYTLSALVENLYFMGAQGTVGVGNALNNKMYGNAGDNQLIGGAGVDEMRGGLGNDMYNVDNAGDIVVEAAGQGTDTVVSSIAYTLGATLENLTLTGAAAINGTGNTLANQLLGNAGANVLNGGLGADYMYGGAGNDTFVVDNAADLAVESNAHGTDTVNASVTFTLMTHVENLNLTGAAAINGTGNGLANTILGNAAGNIIDGLQGADIMTGGLGADTFVFSQLGAVDTITDFNAPFDTIRVSNAAFGGVLTVGAFVTFVSGATPAPAQARPTFLYDTDDGRVLYDRDGSGVVFAPVHFATLTGAPAIGVGDFAVVA